MLSSPHSPDHSPGSPSPHPAGHAADDPPEHTALDGLIDQTRRLREGVVALRGAEPPEGERHRLHRAAWEGALHRLDDFGERLGELRAAHAAPGESGTARLHGRVGSAEWNLLTDEVVWSEELYPIFGRPVADGPLSLDQLPSCLPAEDQPALTAAVTGCLVDGRPVDCEFRVRRPDGSLRTVEMAGEPVLDDSGGAVAMWAVIRDVSVLRRPEAPGRPGRDERLQQRRLARAGHQFAVELQDPALTPWLSPREPRPAAGAPGAPEIAARYLPSGAGAPAGGKWHDTLDLADGSTVLSLGDLSGSGTAAAGAATAVGAIRGIALTGTAPAALLRHLDGLLDQGAHPVLGNALCCRYEPVGRRLTWAQAGHPTPLLCRAGGARPLLRPAGVLLGSLTGAAYEERTEELAPGDVLVLHTDGLFSDSPPVHRGDPRLLALAPRLASAGSAGECLRIIADARENACGEEDACVLVVRIRT